MGHARQNSFFKSGRSRFQHGGELRRKRSGRGKRPLSTKDSLHVVFKMNREAYRPGLRHHKSYMLSRAVIDRYAKRFFIKVIQLSIQGNHIHINAVRLSQRLLAFLRDGKKIKGRVMSHTHKHFEFGDLNDTHALQRPILFFQNLTVDSTRNSLRKKIFFLANVNFRQRVFSYPFYTLSRAPITMGPA